MKRLIVLFLSLMTVVALSAQSFTSSNLPILKVSTSGQSIVDEPKINVNLKIVYNGPGVRNNVNDIANEFDGKIGIEIRGQSSQSFPKKGYGFEFRDAIGDDLDTSFLSFPAESDFVLHGPFSDKSLIRNALAYILAGSIMEYAPRVEMVELTIDDSYQGVYLLTEKIKRDNDRVDISKLQPTEVSGDDLTGGYIFKIDKFSDDDSAWESLYDPYPGAQNRPIYIHHYPDGGDIVQQQQNYIRAIVGNFENVMNSSDYEDEVIGYPSVIDPQSFVDFFFINEIGRNVDGYRLSTFLSKDKDSKGGKIKAGPVWDFNLGFGNADYCEGWRTQGWAYDFNNVCPQDFFKMPFWWPRLLVSTSFKRRAHDRWVALRQGDLSDDRIFAIYDSLGVLLQESQARNFQKWSVLGQYVWPNFQVSNTYTEELQWTRAWLTSRLAWMDSQINSFPSSITNQDYLSDFLMYPVPLEDVLTIDLVPKISGQAKFQIFDVLGRGVWSQSMVLNAGGHTRKEFQIDLPQGYFVYQITVAGQIIKSGKIIKI